MEKRLITRTINYRLFVVIMVSVLIASCAKRNLVYFDDLTQSTALGAPIKNYSAPLIQPNDIISISVSTLSAESNVMFNLVLLPQGTNNNVIAEKVDVGYLVDPDGTINFPVIGRITVGGLTRQQATERITNLIKEHVKDPIVNVRYTNFTVTVIGEVARPASFVVPTERITILEAIGLAGDMTVFGKRESVLIIREKDGVRSTTQVSLNSKDILTSPFYYLKQNDIVYVEPDNKVKIAATQPYNRFIGLFTALMTTTVFVILAVNGF